MDCYIDFNRDDGNIGDGTKDNPFCNLDVVPQEIVSQVRQTKGRYFIKDGDWDTGNHATFDGWESSSSNPLIFQGYTETPGDE